MLSPCANGEMTCRHKTQPNRPRRTWIVIQASFTTVGNRGLQAKFVAAFTKSRRGECGKLRSGKKLIRSSVVSLACLPLTACYFNVDEAPIPSEMLVSATEVSVEPVATSPDSVLPVDPSRLMASLNTTSFRESKRPGQLPGIEADGAREIKRALERYQGADRAYVVDAHRRRQYFDRMMKEVFTDEGVPHALINVALVESCYKVKAVSPAGATGMWQFMQGTARQYGLEVGSKEDQRKDPVLATIAATRLLRDLYQQFGDWKLALAAYNAGPGRVRGAMSAGGTSNFWEISRQKLLPRETREYVAKVYAAAMIDKEPVKHGFVEIASLKGA
jgi:hypothetical protein